MYFTSKLQNQNSWHVWQTNLWCPTFDCSRSIVFM